MYSLDINFLNDRIERQTDATVTQTRSISRDDPRPLYVGAAIGLLLPALMGAFWLWQQNQNAALLARQQELDSQLATLQAAMREVENVNAQVAQLDAENQALTRVFDRIVPWSALLQDMRGRVPAGVQITNIVQTQEAAAPAPTPPPPADPNQPAPPPAVPELPPPKLEITGNARNFAEANDFVLVLQQSPFLDSDSLKLIDARLVDNPTQVELVGTRPARAASIQVELPRVVQYKITGTLTRRSASELLQDMKNTLAVGLPARVDALRDLGVIQP